MHGSRRLLVVHAEEELAGFAGLRDAGRRELAGGELGTILAVVETCADEAGFAAVAEIRIPLEAGRNGELPADGLIELGAARWDINQQESQAGEAKGEGHRFKTCCGWVLFIRQRCIRVGFGFASIVSLPRAADGTEPVPPARRHLLHTRGEKKHF